MTTPNKATPTKRYIFRTAQFQCGCVYQILGETAAACPQHQSPISREANYESHTPENPGIPGLVMSQYFKSQPHILHNHNSNSLHNLTSVRDGQGNSWIDEQEDQTGLCAACLIDEDSYTETGYAICECGNENCSYRWCGATQGLHALWAVHVQGKAMELLGWPDEDIFSYGPYLDQKQEIKSILNEEQKLLIRRMEILLDGIKKARSNRNPELNSELNSETEGAPDEILGTGYLTPWLDDDYERAVSQKEQPEGKRYPEALYLKILAVKLLRLHLVSPIPDPGQQSLDL